MTIYALGAAASCCCSAMERRRRSMSRRSWWAWFQRDRTAIAAIALTTDTSVLTSVGNDQDTSTSLARQIEALGRAGDIALAISTKAACRQTSLPDDAARRSIAVRWRWTGCDGGDVGRASDIHINVPAHRPARVQEGTERSCTSSAI